MRAILPKLLPVDFKSKVVPAMPEHEYHATHDFVSSSGLKAMRKSPLHFIDYLEMNQSGYSKKDTDAMKFGRLCHAAVLEPKRMKENSVVQPDFGDFRSEANRDNRDAWLATRGANEIVLTQDELSGVTRVANAVLGHKEIASLLQHQDTVFEHSFFYRHPETGIGVRARVDVFNPTLGLIIDLKTASNVDPGNFSRAIATYSYHLQAAAYIQAVSDCTGVRLNDYRFIAVESSSPNSVVLYKLDEAALDYGTAEHDMALKFLAACLQSGQWPGYQSFAGETISLPQYIFNKALEF